MKLIASKTSPFARKLRVLLAEKQIAFDWVDANPWAADSSVPSLSPLGKVPVLQLDDGTNVFDSAVAGEYLDSLAAPALIPAVPHARMLAKRWEALASGMLDNGIFIFLERKRPAELQNTEMIARRAGQINGSAALASQWLGEHPFCAGELFSYADIALGTALLWLDFRLSHEVQWRQHANLVAAADRLMARESFASTAPPAA